MQPQSHLFVSVSGSLALVSLTQPEALRGWAFGVDPLAVATVSVAAAAVCMLPDIDKRILFMGHRTWTHTAWSLALLFACVTPAVASLSLLLPFLAPLLWLGYQGVIYSFVLHLAADMLTVTGLQLLYPIPIRFWLLPRFLRIVTGGWLEGVYALVLVSAFASLALKSLGLL